MKGTKLVYICSECEYTSPKWLGKCPHCGAWNSFVEDVIAKGEEVLASTVVDQKKFKEVEDEINAVLAKYGKYSYPEEPTAAEAFFGNALEGTSKFLVDTIGGGSLVDWILSPIRGLFAKMFK